MTTMTHSPSERALNEQELIDVCERYGAFIYQRAFHYLQSASGAESVSVEVLMQMRRKGRRLLELDEPKERVRWLDMIILRTTVAWLRDAQRTTPV